MRTSFGAALILAASATFQLAHAGPCTLALNSAVPILPDGTIAVKIDGAPARLLFDTGSFTSIISSEAAQRLHLRPDPDTSQTFRGITADPWTLEGIGKARLGSEVMANRFEVGELVGRKFHLLTSDMNHDIADGVLSTDFAAEYDVDLNFPAQEIRLFRAYGSCGHAKVFLQGNVYATPLLDSTDDRRPRVAAYIHGRRLVALVDTGAQHSSIFLTTALSLGVTAEDLKGDRAFKVQGIGIGQVGAMMHVFPALTVGDLTLRNTKLLVIADRSHDDTEIILGADFQHRLHLWISNSGKSLIMQYPPMPSPAVPAGWLATSHQRK